MSNAFYLLGPAHKRLILITHLFIHCSNKHVQLQIRRTGLNFGLLLFSFSIACVCKQQRLWPHFDDVQASLSLAISTKIRCAGPQKIKLE